MKKIKALNIDNNVYEEFRIYAISVGRSISSLIEEYMRTQLKKINK